VRELRIACAASCCAACIAKSAVHRYVCPPAGLQLCSLICLL